MAENVGPEVVAEQAPYEHDDKPGESEIKDDDQQSQSIACRWQAGEVDLEELAVVLCNPIRARKDHQRHRRCPNGPKQRTPADRLAQRGDGSCERSMVRVRAW